MEPGHPGRHRTCRGGEWFGTALAAARFNGDAYDELTIGVPCEELAAGPDFNSGAMHAFHGAGTGLSASQPVAQPWLDDQFWHQDS